MIRVMLTAAAIWMFGLSVCATADEAAFNKRISVQYAEKPFVDTLKEAALQAGVRLTVPGKLLAGWTPVTYEAKDQEAGRVLTRLLRPRGLGLKINGAMDAEVVKLDPLDEFQVKPEAVFEFAEKPTVTRQDDVMAVSFATKGWCDATVAIEDGNGRIIRHLASGVLGVNAPEPFQWNAKKQTLVWDGKDDQGKLIDDKSTVAVRVSLGLKPQFERTLYWEPKKRLAARRPLIQAAADGVYVYDEGDFDQLRVFDHEANYARTVYPFAADKLDKVSGLEWQTSPQDGLKIPVRHGNYPASLLPVLPTGNMSTYRGTAMAVRDDRIALAGRQLIRLAKDGTSGGLPFVGPKCAFKRRNVGYSTLGEHEEDV